jgi:hypothetical protein
LASSGSVEAALQIMLLVTVMTNVFYVPGIDLLSLLSIVALGIRCTLREAVIGH